jgi:hypothetical protein
MSTQIKGVTGRTGDVSMVSFFGGKEDGTCVQMTFKKPEEARNKSDFGFWYLQLTKEQALEMAVALVQFANGTREEVYG